MTKSTDAKRLPKSKRISALALAGVLGLGFVGCGTSSQEPAVVEPDNASNTSITLSGPALSPLNAKDLFTVDYENLDLEVESTASDSSYDKNSATTITLGGTEASIEGMGASAAAGIVTINEGGTYVLSGSLDSGRVVIDAADAEVHLVLNGATVKSGDSPAIEVLSAKSVTLTLEKGSENTLQNEGVVQAEDGEDALLGAVISSVADLTLNGEGGLTVKSANSSGIASSGSLVVADGTYEIAVGLHGLYGSRSVKIADGDFTITAQGSGIRSDGAAEELAGVVALHDGTYAIDADDAIHVNTFFQVNDGDYTLKAADDAFQSDNDGYVAGGDFSVNAVDDAFHSEYVLVVEDGTVDVEACTEGYESEKVYVLGGETDITSSDDAVNASEPDVPLDATAAEESSGNNASNANNANNGNSEVPANGMQPAVAEGCLIQIEDGVLVINAEGDGIDSNGNVVVNGGVIVVNGPTTAGNGAFDYDGSATINGGIALMVGPADMVQSFTSGDQPFGSVRTSGKAGDLVTLADADGKAIISMTAEKAFQSVVASAPDLVEGQTYQVIVGGTLSGATSENGVELGGSVSGGSSSEFTAEVTGTQGMGFGPGMQGGTPPEGEFAPDGTPPEGELAPDGTPPDGEFAPSDNDGRPSDGMQPPDRGGRPSDGQTPPDGIRPQKRG